MLHNTQIPEPTNNKFHIDDNNMLQTIASTIYLHV